MKLEIKGEQVFEINGHTLAISQAPAAYTLQFSVTGDFDHDCQDVINVPAGEQCTGTFPYGGGSFRCKGLAATDTVIVLY